MTASNYLRDHTNWHRLHCDIPGCLALFIHDERYGHLDRLRDIAAERHGWSWALRDPVESAAPRAWDFCPRHSVVPLHPAP